MVTIFWRTLWDKKYTLLAYWGGEFIMVWMYTALFPTIDKISSSYNQILETFPHSLLEAFGFEGSFTGFASYLAAEHYGIIWPIVLIPFLASLAGAAITKEIEDGTIELVLALPVARWKIFFAKYVAGIVALLLFLLFSILSTIPMAYLYHIDFAAESFYYMALLGGLFGWAVYSFGMLLTVLFSERGKVYMILGGTLVVMYFLKIVAVLSENLVNLKYLSFFYYFNAGDALIQHIINAETYWVFIGISIVCTISATIWFTKRDVAV